MMESGNQILIPEQQEKTVEQIEEEKLKARYPNLVTKGPSLLQKRLNRNVKYFDSGDYNMAKAKVLAKPTDAQHPVRLNLGGVSEGPTGDTIPTPDNVPAVCKKMQLINNSLHLTTNDPTAVGHLPPGSPTKPTTESVLFTTTTH